MKREQGHKLLARLGKTKLRPGGQKGTTWLLNHIELKEDTKFLEVACNMGTSLISLAKKYDIEFVGVDKDSEALEKAGENIKNENLESRIRLQKADALNLPFEDESFDYILNEAMLTMLNKEDKEKAVKEYFRVLKPGGILLTHDIVLTKDLPAVVKILQKIINVPANPITLDNWKNLFNNAGFQDTEYDTGEMTLMSDEGMLSDEGEEGKNRILENAKSDPNYSQFLEMKNFFGKHKDILHYVVFKNVKL